MPPRSIQLRSCHPWRSSLDHHHTLLQRPLRLRLAFSRTAQALLTPALIIPDGLFLHINPSVLGIALSAVQRALNAGQEIEVMIEGLGCS